ncbi:pickpocket protein 28-like [Amphibalanus amphitrite]|uniref:pickpocket protein 28-like n=1 Tax=Amphibalanus amphitrite TaxID=1232801 RepID=UPI001C92A8E0|nr:pickpocket protein 28-like [Amphibalanus amphitrite]
MARCLAGYRDIFREQAEKYCEETTIHGVKYLARERSAKRWYWGVIVLGTFCSASFLIYGVVDNYFRSPTLVSIETTDYPVHRIPFPALTICNLNKISNSSLPPDQQTVLGRVVYPNETEWRQRVLDALEIAYMDSCAGGRCPLSADSCEGDHCLPSAETRRRTHDIPPEQVRKIMAMTSPSCDEMVVACLWRGRKTPCSKLFKTQRTDLGYCCLFNAHYDSAKQDGVLYSGSGNKNGLTVMIDVKRYEYYLSHFLSVGFKILVHGTHDEPEVRQRGMAIPPGQEIFVAVTAEETYTTARAESSFTPEERNCYMEHERALRHADTTYYTLANCLLSREAQALVDRCGCVAFYVPGMRGWI